MMWLLDMLSVEDYVGDIKVAIKNFGDSYIEKEPFWYMGYTALTELNLIDEPVMSLCSLSAAQCIKRSKVYPGVYCDLDKYKVSRYSKYLHNHMLNDYYYFPLWKLLKSKSELFRIFGNNDAIFIRPDSGFKTFNGMILYGKTFISDVEDIISVSGDLDEWICVSETKNIYREWRLVIAKDKVAGSSQYKNKGKLEIITGCPASVKDFAEIVAKSIDTPPDLCYVMDIAETTFGPKVIELNSFSCSGLYACNIKETLHAVREVVLEDYNDFNDPPF